MKKLSAIMLFGILAIAGLHEYYYAACQDMSIRLSY